MRISRPVARGSCTNSTAQRSLQCPVFNLRHQVSLFAFGQRERQRKSDSGLRPGALGPPVCLQFSLCLAFMRRLGVLLLPELGGSMQASFSTLGLSDCKSRIPSKAVRRPCIKRCSLCGGCVQPLGVRRVGCFRSRPCGAVGRGPCSLCCRPIRLHLGSTQRSYRPAQRQNQRTVQPGQLRFRLRRARFR